jgi:hypothetical protein
LPVEVLFLIVPVVVMLGAVFVLGLIVNPGYYSQIRGTSSAFGAFVASIGATPSAQGATLVRGRRRYDLSFSPAYKGTPEKLTVRLSLDPPGVSAKPVISGVARVLVRGQTGTDRLGLRLGLNRAVTTGDPAFDAGVYLESSDPVPELQALFAQPVVRGALQRVLALGFTSVTIDAFGPSLTLLATNPAAGLYQRFPHAAYELEAMAEALPAIAPRTAPTGSWWQGATPVVAFVATAILGASGAGMAQTHPTIDGTPWEVGGIIGLSAAVVGMAVTWLMVRGTWHGLRTFVAVSATLLIGLQGLCGGGAHLLDVELDDAKVTVHPTTVARTWVTRSKNGSTNHVSIRSWRRDETEIELPYTMTRASWQPGDKVKVGSRPGAFGWEWIVWAR